MEGGRPADSLSALLEKAEDDCIGFFINDGEENKAQEAMQTTPTRQPAPAQPQAVRWCGESPEQLVFGPQYQEEADSRSREKDERRRKNAAAAAKSRKKKKTIQESMRSRHEALENENARLRTENHSLHTLNTALESQLSFFQNLLHSRCADNFSPRHDDRGGLPLFRNDTTAELNSKTELSSETLCSGSKRKNLACHAVVLAAILSVSAEDSRLIFGKGGWDGDWQTGTADPTISAHSHSRALLWIDEKGRHGTHAREAYVAIVRGLAVAWTAWMVCAIAAQAMKQSCLLRCIVKASEEFVAECLKNWKEASSRWLIWRALPGRPLAYSVLLPKSHSM